MSQRLLVADSGPLIALGRLGLLNLPIRMFVEVLVTSTVWNEVAGGQAREEHLKLEAARQQGWLTVVDDPAALPAEFASPLLDAGERTALSLALASEFDCGRPLVDETLASLGE